MQDVRRENRIVPVTGNYPKTKVFCGVQGTRETLPKSLPWRDGGWEVTACPSSKQVTYVPVRLLFTSQRSLVSRKCEPQ